MINLGLARFYFGVEFQYCLFRIWLHKKTYIKKILMRYGMINCIPLKIPMDLKVQLQQINKFKLF
jgi:hypothetical protein